MSDNDQNEFGLPIPGNNKRNSSDLLPRFFRTKANKKFLQSTLDQLIQPGVAEKINGYFGRKTAKSFRPSDSYIGDVSSDRENYQFEPATVIKDDLDNVTFYKDYNDYINQLSIFGSNTSNHSRLNSQETYSWNPNIDWDKFVNFREYYWLPTGPTIVSVRGQNQDVVSTYTVSTVEEDDNVAYIFNDGFERNPTLKLYRGQKYRFEIDAPNHPIAFALTKTFIPGTALVIAGNEGVRAPALFDTELYGNEFDTGDFVVLPSSGSVSFLDDENVSTLYPDGIVKIGEQGEEIANVYIEKGIIEFTVPLNAPDRLYYISKNSVDTSGLIRIENIEENTFLDVEADILGKKDYISANGVEFTNGLKVTFQGNVTPEIYQTGNWYVEGVGQKIVLIQEDNLIIPSAYSENKLIPFDSQGFDSLPFGNASAYPMNKDYILINRASQDRNAWSRYNRWFHRSVIEKSLEYNKLPVNVDESQRAKRPIIEFNAGLKLFNYGTEAKKDVDLIDNVTKDVFSEIEGQLGYNVDGVDLANGMRVLFSADEDLLVNGKIYTVNFITVGNNRQISLLETDDSEPLENQTVFVTQGSEFSGKSFYYNGTSWILGQEKISVNQPPRFDMCCPLGNFYGDLQVFDSSTFNGTKLFSYKIGEGTNDPELGFPLTYKNINNSGDIVFEFNLLTDNFLIQTEDNAVTVETKNGHLRNYKNRTEFEFINGWNSIPTESKQRVLRQYVATRNLKNNFLIDVYDNSGDLNDLSVIVLVNNKLAKEFVDYEIDRISGRAIIRFYNNLNVDDIVLIKTNSNAEKNSNGYYEFPINLERNPLNENPTEFTLGEVIDHVDSMIEEIQTSFNGTFPGNSNLRDLGNINKYGKRFVKHSGPIPLALYHVTNKDYNIIKAIDYSKQEYSRFKRIFTDTATNLGYTGPVKIHVDKILNEINKDKVKTEPFYFSDMIGYRAANRIEYKVLDQDNTLFPFVSTFDLTELSTRSVNVYLNGVQLLYNRDYIFRDSEYIEIIKSVNENDLVEIYEYESTDGSFVPPTPTKLGIYPKYEPEIVIDDSYITDSISTVNFENPSYISNSILGKNLQILVTVSIGISNYSVTLLSGGTGYSVGDTITISGTELNGKSPANNCIITVQSVDKNGSVISLSTSGLSPQLMPLGPYKIYGESDLGSRGWFYPVYLSKKLADEKDLDNQSQLLRFKGLNKLFYIPKSGSTLGGQDSIDYNEYPEGIPMIRGHDGSYIKAYKDYRDNLILDLEFRIFNNIKIEYNTEIFDIHNFVSGKFRKTGFTRSEINKTLLKDFVQWTSLIDNDYTKNDYYTTNNQFTYNYSNMTSVVDGETLPGFWRAVYKELYDTDRPHTCPWEMLGFTIKPTWWDSVYGPAPYTSNNLIMWGDLEEGKISIPGKPVVINSKYARPGLKNFIPVNSQGQLKSPILSNCAKGLFFRNISKNFIFGDEAPVETAWRRSSEYPFAILKSWLLNQPARVIGTAFDVSKIKRNLAGQYVYSTFQHITLDNIVFPNTYQDNNRQMTSGLVNYIYNLLASDILSTYENYKSDIQGLNCQLGLKIAGFTDKEKFKLLLDSRSPRENFTGGIFVPEENYQIFLNTSSPIAFPVYSGVIIEKQPEGFIVRGYDIENPFFTYYEPVETQNDFTVVIGGISETVSLWAENKRFVKGQIVEFNSQYFRVVETFTSGNVFDNNNLAKLSELPIIGGRRAKIRKTFNTDKSKTINYGSRFETIQQVVDFLLGYESFLKNQGFEFNYYDNSNNRVENWTTAAKEFLFWTTQGWTAGTTITLSPSAYEIKFNQSLSVVDDVFDNFYGYSLQKADGLPLEKKFSNIFREENSFGINSENTGEGIYNIRLPLVQKEHVVLLDNKTEFSDIIYQPSTGYRQERIKVLGYRSDNWNGSLNIPGFIYDDAKIVNWEPWKDFDVGSLVKYKEFFYVAVQKAFGSEDFNFNNWYRLNQKPESQLNTNFDYRINQFTDFYDLDTDGFDSEQQQLAQHLIGYQKRQYLANIINDDVSQYKFYQGFIQDKGTKNAIDKLFGKLSSSGQDAFEYNEEWAIQLGRYGAIDDIKQVEYIMQEEKFQESPQAIELVESIPQETFDKVFRINSFEVYDKPENYNHKPFPTTNLNEYILSGGYVHEDDVEYKTSDIQSLEQADINQIKLGEYIWVTNDLANDWSVYQVDNSIANVISFETTNSFTENNEIIYDITVDKWTNAILNAGDIVGIKRAEQFGAYGMYRVISVNFNKLSVAIRSDLSIQDFNNSNGAVYPLVKLRSVRVDNFEQFNLLAQNKIYKNQRVWVDNDGNNNWVVLKNNKVYNQTRRVNNPSTYDSTDHEFSKSMGVTDNNRTIFVSAPGDDNGSIYYYSRSKETNEWISEPKILPPTGFFDINDSRFGESISVSEDGKFLAVGIPEASSVKTRYKGEFNSQESYNKNDIVKYRETLWKATRQILPETNSQEFSTFDSYYQLIQQSEDSSALNLLYTGHLGFENSTVQNTGNLNNSKGHILVKAPVDMYLGSKIGDAVSLHWNNTTFLNDQDVNSSDLEIVEPFNGSIQGIDKEFLTGQHLIKEKIEAVFLINPFLSLPEIGDTVENDTGTAVVKYLYFNNDRAIIYVSDIKGVFNIEGELFRIDPTTSERQLIGLYSQEQTVITNDLFGGYWVIETPVYTNGTVFVDDGKGLVYSDLVTAEQQSDPTRPFGYFNIQETINQIGVYLSNNLQSSFITQLSYFGDPAGEDFTSSSPASYPSDLWVIRGPKEYTDNISIGDSFKFELFNYNNRIIDFSNTGLTSEIINKEHKVHDLWDGYIDFEFTRFDFNGFPFEPQIGDILEDVQTPFNDEGGLALTSTTTSSAEVQFIQRDFNNVRVYVKIVENRDGTIGSWNILNNIARVELRRRSNELIRETDTVDRVIGTINDFRNDVVLSNSPIGKLIVVKNNSEFPVIGSSWADVNPIVDEEYWFYNENLNELGTSRISNLPSNLNKDYQQIFNVSADSFGEPGPINEGAVAIYKQKTNNLYELQTVLTSEYGYNLDGTRKENRKFGSKVQITKNQNLYTLIVSSQGDANDSSLGNSGSIEIFKHGTMDLTKFKNVWNPSNNYNKDDIVEYQGDYYQAKLLVPVNDISISNTIYWQNISWSRGKDKNYRGDWNNEQNYSINSIVVKDNKLYQAQTNIASDTDFDLSLWKEITSVIDYLGYLPNLTGNAYYDENVFNPAENIVQYADNFVTNKTGTVLVVKSIQEINDSTISNVKILIYRLLDSKYILSQVIEGSNNIDGFGESMDLNPSGTLLAIGEPFNDSLKKDSGRVHIYRQQNNQFELSQILESPQKEVSEKFGSSLSYSSDNLVVTSLTGDMILPTTFDVLSDIETTFDNGFTEFRNLKIDTGNVYIYEEINQKLVFSESFQFKDVNFNFGENLLANNNFVYVGMTDYKISDESSVGTVIEYRKSKNQFAWEISRELKQPVDISKIKGAFLYNRRKNQIITYLDFIDPIQGKIAGPAEQEITFKTAYDPARYTVDAANNNENLDISWQEEHVGKLWWNINLAKFTYPYQGSIQYQKDNWNELQPDSVIAVYEWVESDLLPSQWDSIADTEKGIAQGISGRSLYGDDRFSRKYIYDTIAKAYTIKYYFWVINKRSIPNNENRVISAFDVAQLIARPREQGYRYISFLGNDRFILNNCNDLIYNDDIVLNIRYSTQDRLKEQNIHSQYQIISDGSDTSLPHPDIERKWFDSLIGVDEQNRPVPAENLTVKQKYGIQNSPRQSMFVNRIEALKQTIERINLILKKNIIVDEYNLSNLLLKDNMPSEISGNWDVKIQTHSELSFVSTNKIEQAELQPVIINGKIVSVNILNSGRGYKIAPTITVRGSGSDAEFIVSINNLGQITNVDVINQGKNYNDDTKIIPRKFSVLIENDENTNGKWTIYSWNNISQEWLRSSIQDFDVSVYWNYVDWYEDGYNSFTSPNFNIDQSYELFGLSDQIGDLIKINNVGSGGWLLLEKVNNEITEDYTVNYKTVGRQNGTIQLKDSLYNFSNNSVGYDNSTFDNKLYDVNPTKELRIILKTIRDNIFINELRTEYNQLFFSSLRYVLSEQLYVDWMFKTSFIKIKHNLGELKQDITFNNNSLSSYESYVKEVKPYKTVIREFVSSYKNIDPTNTSVIDFDTPASYYNSNNSTIMPTRAKIVDDIVINNRDIDVEYPRKHWYDNLGYKVTEIKIDNGGSNYTFKPVVKLEGGGGSGATAEAYIGYGSVTKIKVTNPGSGYTSAPKVIIEGSQLDNSVPAQATAILGEGLVRTPTITIRFDRVSGEYYISQLNEVETFTGTGSDNEFELKWPMDLRLETVKITVNGEEKLRSEYNFENVEYKTTSSIIDTEFNYGLDNTAAGPGRQKFTNGYTYQKGKIKFTVAPAAGSEIVVSYMKPLSMLNAEDRINFAYNPENGMFGKDLSQLMLGIDYGGVNVQSLDFGQEHGWDTNGWFVDNWDQFNNPTEDYIFNFDGSTIFIDLEEPLENEAIYNVYYRSSGTSVGNEVRLDDPNYNTVNQTNPNAIMNSIVGDGVTQIIDLDELGIKVFDGDTLIIRKTTSDGSINPDPTTYDTALTGGDLAYSTARGINAEDVVVDGDGFVTSTTSGGPEELVPGQVLDTLDITVYTKETDGQGVIYSQNYIMNLTDNEFDLGVIPSSPAAVFVKVNNIILNESEFEIDWINNKLRVNNPVENAELSIVVVEGAIRNIVDYGNHITSENITEYDTGIKYINDLTAHVTVNGIKTDVILLENESSNITIQFDQTVDVGQMINYVFFNNTDQVNYSQITKETFVINQDNKDSLELSQAPFYQIPTTYNTLVKVNNKILNPGYNIQYMINDNRQQEYNLEEFQQPGNALESQNLKVFVNGEEIFTPTQWRFEISSSRIILSQGIGNAGDKIEIFVITDGEYIINEKSVIFTPELTPGDIVEVYKFSNHDLLDSERINYDVVDRKTLIPEDIDYITYNRLTVGEISLRKPAAGAEYVWVSVNGELLSPNVDYAINENGNKLQLLKTPNQNDVIDILHFTAPVRVRKFAFRQFKDILNRTHYKRLDSAATKLSKSLNYYDLRIEVVDGSKLPEPSKENNLPGIIFINGERIEYFVKDGNILRQLRRGTLGTGIKELHEINSDVFSQNADKTIPYQDTTQIQTEIADGNTNQYELKFNANSQNEFEVFVAGNRLRKSSYQNFDPTLALNSPDGDVEVSADFTFDSETNTITLKDTPSDKSTIQIVRKVGKLWTDLGKTLSETQNDIGYFLRAGTSQLPK